MKWTDLDRRRAASLILLAAGGAVLATSGILMADALTGEDSPRDEGDRPAAAAHEGDIPALLAAGVGDPRPALPEGYELGYADMFCDLPSQSECTSRQPGDRTALRFEGSWSNGKGFLNISVQALPPESLRLAGRLTEGHYGWNDGELQYYVSGQEESTAHSHETLAAVARALDPGFDDRCVSAAVGVPLDELDIPAPRAPHGFRLDLSNSWRNDVSGDCAGVPDAQTGFFATWTFFDAAGGRVIEVQAGNAPEITAVGQPNSVTPYGFYWTDAKGVDYVVNGFKGEFDVALLAEVAEGVDPAFDLTKLAPAR